MDQKKLIEGLCAAEDECGVTLPIIVTRLECEQLCDAIRNTGAIPHAINPDKLEETRFGVRLDGTFAKLTGDAQPLFVYRGRAVVRAAKAAHIEPASVAEYKRT